MTISRELHHACWLLQEHTRATTKCPTCSAAPGENCGPNKAKGIHKERVAIAYRDVSEELFSEAPLVKAIRKAVAE
jgi:hypothetical protein